MEIPDLTQWLDGALTAIRRPATAQQWGVIFVALVAGLVAHVAARRAARSVVSASPPTPAPAGSRPSPLRWVERLAFPFVALAIVVAGRAVLSQFQPTHLLRVAVALLGAMLVVRAAEYALRYVFAPGGWLAWLIRAIATVIWIGVALQILGLLPDLLKLLEDMALTIGRTRISVLDVLQGSLSILIALVGALWVSRLIEEKVMGADSVDITMRVMFAKLTKAILLVVAILLALPALGIDLTALSVFGGALGVGLGLGLQKIASNYLSGFIILLDRSVKIGDVVTIDGRSGVLTQMTSRYVVVRGGDGTEALIPNDTLITATVINQTYSDRQARASVAVTVDAAADVDRALALMTDAAAQHPQVLRRPAPVASIRGWTDFGLQLELGVWYEQPAGPVAADLQLSIWRAFRDHGIAFASPRATPVQNT